MADAMMTPEATGLVAGLFKVLSEPLRLHILQLLEDKKMSVNDISEGIGASQSSVSKHLKTLYAAGMLDRERNGTTVNYWVGDEFVFKLCDLVCTELHMRLEKKVDSLGEPFTRLRKEP